MEGGMGMTMKKTVLVFALIFVLTAAANFVIHGILLQGVYQQSSALFRTPADGQAHALFLLVGFFFFAAAFVRLYPRNSAGGRVVDARASFRNRRVVHRHGQPLFDLLRHPALAIQHRAAAACV
jgi:hypothetical protein